MFINMISDSLQEDADNVQGYQELTSLQAAIEQALLESGKQSCFHLRTT